MSREKLQVVLMGEDFIDVRDSSGATCRFYLDNRQGISAAETEEDVTMTWEIGDVGKASK